MSDCVFCRPAAPELATDFETDAFEARWDGHPLTLGHALVIPKDHKLSLFSLSAPEVAQAFLVLFAVRNFIERLHAPDGYNIGINDGVAAGRTVHHLHIHLIPRYTGDTPDPRGGIRNMLPGPSPDLWAPLPVEENQPHGPGQDGSAPK